MTPDALMRIIAENRGITADKLADFLNPNYDTVADPFSMHDMSPAIDTIVGAITTGQRIAIYADYDADGIPGAALLSSVFEKIGYRNFCTYIPHRHTEGYGFHKPAIKKLSDDGVNLIITIDVGITAAPDVAYAQSLGITVIVTDHHEPGPVIPECLIVHPKLGEYNDPMICGCAVAFQLARALLIRVREMNTLHNTNNEKNNSLVLSKGSSGEPEQGIPTAGSWGPCEDRTEEPFERTHELLLDVPDGWEKWLLDLVGISTIGDMVPLVNENRIFAAYGLRVLRKSRRPGIIALCRELGIDQNLLSEEDLGFSIIPRLNAASRMATPQHALDVLIATNDTTASALAAELSKLNTKRKNEVSSIMKKAHKRVDENATTNIIMIGDAGWNVGVVGIVAGKIAEEYHKPTFVWTEHEGEYIKGSCRSDGSISVVDIMEYASDAFIYKGGHAAAGGFTAYKKDITRLEQLLNEAVDTMRGGGADEAGAQQSPILAAAPYYDTELALPDITINLYNTLAQLSPFGIGNPRPTFLIRDMVVRDEKFLGAGESHIKLTVTTPTGTHPIEMVAFNVSERDPLRNLHVGDTFSAVIAIESNTFRGRTSLRLKPVGLV